MTERRWIADEWTAHTATLTGAQAHHLVRVLRAAPGLRAHIVVGEAAWSAVVTTATDSEVVFSLDQLLPAEPALQLTLLLAIFKFDRMEWAIEKATELGVARIAPVVTRRTEKHLALAAEKRLERWRRIVHESSKQSRRVDVPAVDAPLPLQHALSRDWPGTRILLAETERSWSLADTLADGADAATLAVGPEGGWTPQELDSFHVSGWRAAGLGPRILRAETAAIAALTLAASSLSPRSSYRTPHLRRRKQHSSKKEAPATWADASHNFVSE